MFQLKVDGFYGLLTHRSDGRVALLSRGGNQLTSSFPELLEAGQALPPGTTVAGEIILADHSGTLSFSALQERLAGGPRLAKRSARRRPASLVVFDLAAWGGTDLSAGNRSRQGGVDWLKSCQGSTNTFSWCPRRGIGRRRWRGWSTGMSRSSKG